MCFTWQRLHGINLKPVTHIAISIFFSACGDRLWTFAIGLYLVKLTPGSLQLAAIYGLVLTLSAFIFSPLIECWIKNKNRLKIVRSLLILQNAFVVVDGLIILIYSSNTSSFKSMLLMMQVFIIVFGAVANLAGQTAKMCLTKDWIVVISRRDSNELAKTNSKLRQIDLSVAITAPVVIGFLMSFISDEAGIVFICLWHVTTIIVGYLFMARVYNGDVELQNISNSRIPTKDVHVIQQDELIARINDAYEPSIETEIKNEVENQVITDTNEKKESTDASQTNEGKVQEEPTTSNLDGLNGVKTGDETSTSNVDNTNGVKTGEEPSTSYVDELNGGKTGEEPLTSNTDEVNGVKTGEEPSTRNAGEANDDKLPLEEPSTSIGNEPIEARTTEEPPSSEKVETNDINIIVESEVSSDMNGVENNKIETDKIEVKEPTTAEVIIDEPPRMIPRNNVKSNTNGNATASGSNVDPIYNDAHMFPRIDINTNLRAFQNRCRHCQTVSIDRFRLLKIKVDTCITSWKVYTNQTIFLAGLALSILYVTILGFNIITISYAYSQGLAEVYVGICFGFGSLIGIAGTFMFPMIQKRVGLFRTGLFGNVLHVIFLIFCVVSIWLPGSPSNLLNNETLVTKNVVIMLNETMFTSKQPVTKNNGKTGNISVIILMIGIILSRAGLWIAELSITQIQQDYVNEGEKGIVGGRQYTLNNFFSLFPFVMTIFLPYPRQFGILILLSTLGCITSFALYSWFCCTIDRKLHEDNWTQTRNESEEKRIRRHSC